MELELPRQGGCKGHVAGGSRGVSEKVRRWVRVRARERVNEGQGIQNIQGLVDCGRTHWSLSWVMGRLLRG